MYFDDIFRGICNLACLDEERTHQISIDLEDDAGILDIFVTITGTTPLQGAINTRESSANVAFDSIPSKLSDKDIKNYVRNGISYLKLKINFALFHRIFFLHFDQ